MLGSAAESLVPAAANIRPLPAKVETEHAYTHVHSGRPDEESHWARWLPCVQLSDLKTQDACSLGTRSRPAGLPYA
jgi:hypothetical protein